MFFRKKIGKTLSIAVKISILRVKKFILRVSKSRELVKNLSAKCRQILKKHKNQSSASFPTAKSEEEITTFTVKLTIFLEVSGKVQEKYGLKGQ